MKSNMMKWKRISSNIYIYKKQVIKYSRRGLFVRKIRFLKNPIFGNLVLIANSEYADNLVKIPTCSSSGLAFCVELWPKQVWYRISVPMSYIWVPLICPQGPTISKKWQLYGKTIAANPRMSIFEKCLKSCFDRLER